jgi:hypothetical protein
MNAQVPTVVNDPKANATLTLLESLQKQVTDAVKKTQKATETLSTFKKLENDAAKVISTMATLKIIQQLLVDLSCQMDELKSSVAIVDNMNNCVFKLDYNIMIMKLQGSTDLIKVGLVGGNAYMALTEKTDVLTKVMSTLENSIKDMQKINMQINASAMEMLRERYNSNVSFNGSVSRQR